VLRGGVSARGQSAIAQVDRIVAWYVANVYGRWEGPGCKPFFADPDQVGFFAIDLERLRERDEAALFKLLVLFSFYQSRRDVDMMQLQRAMPREMVEELASPDRIATLVTECRCTLLRTSGGFDARCDVRRLSPSRTASCSVRPRTACHVKAATAAIGRMSDMGKIPTSAWLHLRDGGISAWFERACDEVRDPLLRAERLVVRMRAIHRIGPKLASMYVSSLSVDELASSFAPWEPEVDGRETLVVDTNVSKIVAGLGGPDSTSYGARSEWLLAIARRINVRAHRADLPHRSPRFIQQALYAFRSASNRRNHGDPCAAVPCRDCPSRLCPFSPHDQRT